MVCVLSRGSQRCAIACQHTIVHFALRCPVQGAQPSMSAFASLPYLRCSCLMSLLCSSNGLCVSSTQVSTAPPFKRTDSRPLASSTGLCPTGSDTVASSSSCCPDRDCCVRRYMCSRPLLLQATNKFGSSSSHSTCTSSQRARVLKVEVVGQCACYKTCVYSHVLSIQAHDHTGVSDPCAKTKRPSASCTALRMALGQVCTQGRAHSQLAHFHASQVH